MCRKLESLITIVVRWVPLKPPLLIYCAWANFQIFLLGSERRFQHTKECDIWILNAEVMKGQSFILKLFLQHKYILILEMYTMMLTILGRV